MVAPRQPEQGWRIVLLGVYFSVPTLARGLGSVLRTNRWLTGLVILAAVSAILSAIVVSAGPKSPSRMETFLTALVGGLAPLIVLFLALLVTFMIHYRRTHGNSGWQADHNETGSLTFKLLAKEGSAPETILECVIKLPNDEVVTVNDDEFQPLRRRGWYYTLPDQTLIQGDYEVRWYERAPGRKRFYEVARERFHRDVA